MQYPLDAGDDLARLAGFGDVVVRAAGEPDDRIHGVVAGGQEDDGDVADRAQPAQDFESVGVGQHHVQQDEVGALEVGAAQTGVSRASARTV